MGAHTEALCLSADSSSSDDDESYEASPATTSESSESPATVAAVLMFAFEPMLNFSAKFYCLAADKNAAFC